MNIEINIPDNKIGDWAIETFVVNEIGSVLSLFSYGSRFVAPGTYKKLKREGVMVMSNTPAEIDDCLPLYYAARGNVLINGLGLGVCLRGILGKEGVKSITIIEKSKDVIDLVSPYINDERVTIICADAFEWVPPEGMVYDCVWHDIWNSVCGDNLPEMGRLHRKYSKKAIWQGSWCKEECKWIRRREREWERKLR